MVRVNPDVKRAERNKVIFANHIVLRCYGEETFTENGMQYRRFYFDPEQVRTICNLTPWISESAPGDLIRDHETKRFYVPKVYQDIYVYPLETKEGISFTIIFRVFNNGETSASKKIDDTIGTKYNSLLAQLEGLRTVNSQLVADLRESKDRYKSDQKEALQFIQKAQTGMIDDDKNLPR